MNLPSSSEKQFWKKPSRLRRLASGTSTTISRDLLLTKGTDLTDYELGMAAQEFGMGRLMSGIKRDGKPHTAWERKFTYTSQTP